MAIAQRVSISRKMSWFLVLFGVWSLIIWPTFVVNVSADPRSFAAGSPTAFLIVHLVLAVLSFVFGMIIGVLGIRGLRARRLPNATEQA